MSKILNYKFYILFLILIIAAFLRLYNLTPIVGGIPAGLYPDEAIDGNNALEALSKLPSLDGFKVFYPENNGREGLFMNIQAVFLKFLMPFYGNNPEPWMLRIVSALFGILSVLGVYFLAKELFGDKIALLSSFFLAVSFWHINFSRISFRAIMAPFFMVWALYFLLKGLNSEKYKFASIVGGIFLGLGFHSYIAFRAMPLLIIIVWIFYWIKNKDKEFRKKIIISAILFTISALIIFAPLGIYFLKNPADFFGRTAELSITHSATPLRDLGMNIIKTAAMFNFVGDFNWRHNYAGRPELFWPVGVMFIAGILSGFYSLFKKKFPFIILFGWLVVASLPVVVSNEGIPHALRSILLIPAVFIFAGFGGVWLYEFIKNNIIYNSVLKTKIFEVFAFFLLSLLFFEAYNTYFIKWGQNPNVQGAFNADYVTIGRQLNSLPKETPKYVVVEATGVMVRGIPMPAQTVMYITDTFLPEKQKEENIYYILPNQVSQILLNSYTIILK